MPWFLHLQKGNNNKTCHKESWEINQIELEEEQIGDVDGDDGGGDNDGDDGEYYFRKREEKLGKP